VRIVLDTNVVMSALLWRRPPYRLLEMIRERQHLPLYSSAILLDAALATRHTAKVLAPDALQAPGGHPEPSFSARHRIRHRERFSQLDLRQSWRCADHARATNVPLQR
jgi:hypothetical protein